LLSFVLGTHPEIATIGELKKFHAKMIVSHGSAKYCSCGNLFLECDFWLKLLKGLKSQYPKEKFTADFSQFEFFKNKYVNQLFFKFCLWLSPKHQTAFQFSFLKTKLSKFLDYNHHLIKKVNDLNNKKVFLDSSKPLKNLLYSSLDQRHDLYIIHLVRDPRGQVNSSLKYNNWTLERTTKKWMQTLEDQLRFLKKNKLKYHRIQYEDFCRNPEQELQEIANFVGIANNFEYTKFRSIPQHIMGNQYMRSGKDSKIEERLDWVKKLSQDDRTLIEGLTQKYRSYYTSSVK